MKEVISYKLQVTTVLLSAAIFIAAGSLFAQREESPSAPSAKQESQRERLSKDAGLPGLSTRTAGPVPTVIPNPEYRQLPSYDFVPKRVRGEQ